VVRDECRDAPGRGDITTPGECVPALRPGPVVQQWRSRNARGDVVIVRYADDFVMGFQHRHEAERFLKDLRERFAKFGLVLHPDKTSLIEFGRFAARDRAKRGESKPETFDFLGFAHILIGAVFI